MIADRERKAKPRKRRGGAASVGASCRVPGGGEDGRLDRRSGSVSRNWECDEQVQVYSRDVTSRQYKKRVFNSSWPRTLHE